jgi:hypothetical protein
MRGQLSEKIHVNRCKLVDFWRDKPLPRLFNPPAAEFPLSPLMATITKRELAIKITDQLGAKGFELTQQDVLEVSRPSSMKSPKRSPRATPW